MRTETELEASLSFPSDRLTADIERIDGDILILGIGGKMGPSLARLARRAMDQAGSPHKVIGVSRFSDAAKRAALEASGIETIAGDLLDESFLQTLPRTRNVIFMAGQKFGTTGHQAYTWAMNTYLPGRVAETFRDSRIVVFSTGNVYPFTPVQGSGATETTPAAPVGEYAQSCLGRERIFHYFSEKYQTPMLFYRLNYALDLRYGVLNDIARKVWNGTPIDLSMGHVNVIWQGDANEYAIRALLHTSCPPGILNVTGPETLSVRWLAEQFATRMDKSPRFSGEPQSTALLSNAGRMKTLLGPPTVDIHQMIEWTVNWIKNDGKEINKPTHYQARDGAF
ncbi:NAD-dependent epimerase/dehydratase family protein [Flavilitoribacter nigricans]|uniref:Epimerase n=1 Tax=Flavilitoribacter nigricans (strain ATCC 23147 / DSM 23189 / NBRC 102662 / NCIMB 1420 / SS-2) TaxID=1122177 RepID=A0A2D0NDQ7_FLAN2|nr:NAD(P)-dependent oxidoreductase [Flavilitoribacter nigricans]PHN06615.1 epimerase [Flavilitoribacter nigricans DSM 23189 = NBRC 102662]